MTVKSLLVSAELDEVLARLDKLSADSRAQWGKMSVVQMLAHCQVPLRAAAGEIELKRGLIGWLFGGMAKRKFIDSDAPFHHNSPTDPKFLRRDAVDLGAQREGLSSLVRRFGETGATTATPHPFFGPLTGREWDRLMWKHLDHHLRQFGV